VNEILVSSFIAVVVEAPPPNVATVSNPPTPTTAVSKSDTDPVWMLNPFIVAPTVEEDKNKVSLVTDAVSPINEEDALITVTKLVKSAPV
jgi:hypothetical protein